MLNKDTWFDVWLDYFYDIGDEEIVERIHKPTPQDLYEALKLAKNLQFFGMHIVLRKGNWIVQVSPAIDDSELDDDDEYDKYLRENEADRIYIKIWYAFGLRITLQDIDFRDYETESTYSDGVFMMDYLYRSLPFDEGVDFIFQFYEHQRLKNYFRHLSHRSYKEFSRTSYQLDDEYIGVNFPDSDEIAQIIEYLKSGSLKRLYIRIQPERYTEEKEPYRRMFRREHILMHPVENHPRVVITTFQRLSENRVEKARMIDKSLYPSDEMVTVRFSDKLSEQIPLHQTIAIDDATDFILKDFVNNHNFCYLSNWL